jgi:hypothetical protein
MMLRMRHNKYADTFGALLSWGIEVDFLAERSPIMVTSKFVELNIYINMPIMYYKLGIDGNYGSYIIRFISYRMWFEHWSSRDTR